jgi:glycosyltransferase XagB
MKDVINYSNKIDYLFIPDNYSAKRSFTKETIALLIVSILLVSSLLGFVYFYFRLNPLVIISGTVALFYLGLIVFKLFTLTASLKDRTVHISEKEIDTIDEEKLPAYTILIPLYDEANVVDQIKEAMTSIDYPAEKLDIWITLEEYDTKTKEAIIRAEFPEHFKIFILPDVKPKTKPKALNAVFPQVRGKFLVIYDAEIVPEPDQLKKAYLAFKKNPEISCFQTRLDHYNADKNLLTKLFNAEFSFYFDLFLPGLQRFDCPIPLSGHSTHFVTEVLRKVGGWDPYNVTEDCDLGIRLCREGYKTHILDSFSYEEATPTLKSWVNQRTRWMKGFIQTSVVHLRNPLRFMEEVGGLKNFIAFVFTVPGTVIVNLLNLLYWVLLLSWIFTQSNFIQVLFPGPILYVSTLSFILGNFLFIYLNIVSVYQRKRYSIVRYLVLTPLYWFLLAVSTVKALFEFIFKPFHWAKTSHGFDIIENQAEVLAANKVNLNERENEIN